jgi:hypothetical protein
LRAVKRAKPELLDRRVRREQRLPFRGHKDRPDRPDRRGQQAQTLPFPDLLVSKGQKVTKATPEIRDQLDPLELTQQFPVRKVNVGFRVSKAFRAKSVRLEQRAQLGQPDPKGQRVVRVSKAKLDQLGQREKLDPPDPKGHKAFREKLGQPGQRVRPGQRDLRVFRV